VRWHSATWLHSPQAKKPRDVMERTVLSAYRGPGGFGVRYADGTETYFTANGAYIIDDDAPRQRRHWLHDIRVRVAGWGNR